MSSRHLVTFSVGIITVMSRPLPADEYSEQILPFMQSYCIDCHAGREAKGELDLHAYSSNRDVVSGFRRWKHIIEFVRQGEMPPEDSPQPSIPEINSVVGAIETILIAEARTQAGDPGVVLPRRLSNTEYDRAVHDLTGVEIRPTSSFPADPSGGEGFDNTGEALTMSPNLVKKYLAAAELVADHMVLKPDGIDFASFPVQSYNERKKLTEQAVIDFYDRHAVDVGRYLETAWRSRHRPDKPPGERIEPRAAEQGVSPKYLEIVREYFEQLDPQTVLGRELKSRWEAIPAPDHGKGRPQELDELIGLVAILQRLLNAPEPELINPGAGNWPIGHLNFREQVAERRDQFDESVLRATAIVKTEPVSAPDTSQPAERSLVITLDYGFADNEALVVVKSPLLTSSDRLPGNEEERKNDNCESLQSVLRRAAPQICESLGFGRGPDGAAIDDDAFCVTVPGRIEIPFSTELQQELAGRRLLLPCELDPARSPDASILINSSWNPTPTRRWGAGTEHLIAPDSRVAHQVAAAGQSFCRTFPNRFFYVNDSRGLAAGFHLVEGFFRDDRPLVGKVLNHAENEELNRLWRELQFVTESTETLLRGFVWFERSEREVLHDERFDFLRSEDPQLVEEQLLGRFERLYLDKLGIRRVGDTLEAETPDSQYAMVHGFFEQIRIGLADHRTLLEHAEQQGLRDLEDFARRAWRRTLQPEEHATLRSFYRELRGEGRTAEEGLRGLLTAVLMSPHFCYYAPRAADGDGIAPLNGDDLATRLSLFLWSSLPDDELLSAAAAGQLQTDAELVAQTRRMLKSPAVSSFAREFPGQWLRYRDFPAKDPINGEAFPGYDGQLRAAMADEPVRLAMHIIHQDRPITELLTSDVSFVNLRLAAHYGGQIRQEFEMAWNAYDGDRSQPDDVWLPVSRIHQDGRSGLLGMAVVLTKNSAGERTSPVKRGFWTAHHLLGQHFPPPPADVPELPKSEHEADRTIRELLARHVEDSKCAMCHRHFDSLGLAMEGFDPIGRSRSADSAGRPIDNRADLPGGGSAKGIPELVDYLLQNRRDELIRNFCRKFLGYALGRSVILSDEPLLADMETALRNNDDRISVLFETVVLSRQFRNQRGREFVAGAR